MLNFTGQLQILESYFMPETFISVFPEMNILWTSTHEGNEEDKRE